ncbi:hypothetical protein ACFL17_05965 [Pseudomonadota bacterium]
MNTITDAKKSLLAAWPKIREECLSVLGSELHYQAVVYHCLRIHGAVPVSQLGMNVKMSIKKPVSTLFKELVQKRHQDYRGGFEPIPDVVIFRPEIDGDWRRRNNENTLINMLIAIEVKASERAGARLRSKEIITDIDKLAAHREEAKSKGADMLPVMMIIDSAQKEKERMTFSALESSIENAKKLDIGILYCSPTRIINTINDS